MPIEMLLFDFVALGGAAYFVLIRRGMDLLTLGYFSTLVYFFPGFTGYVRFDRPVEPGTYAVFVLVLSVLILTGALVRPRRVPALLTDLRSRRRNATLLVLVSAGALGAFGFIIAVNGYSSLLVPKGESGISGITYVFWRVFASLAVVCGIVMSRKGIVALGGTLVAVTYVAGDRTALATTAFAVGVEIFRRYGRVTMLRYWRPLLLSTSAIALLILTGKSVQAGIWVAYRYGNPALAFKLISNAGSTERVAGGMEAIGIQAILNEVVRNDLNLDAGYLLSNVYQLTPSPSMFGVASTYFNDVVQARLFPNEKQRSMAYNYWAEGYATGGYAMVSLFLMLYVVGLLLCDSLSRSPQVHWRGGGLLLGSYWAFYIHRNSLGSILAYERPFFYLVCALAVVTYIAAMRRHEMPAVTDLTSAERSRGVPILSSSPT